MREADEEGSTALLSACYFGKVKIVSYLLYEGLSSIDEVDSQNRNCLFLACEGGSLKTVKALFEYVASPVCTRLLDEKRRGDSAEIFRATFR